MQILRQHERDNASGIRSKEKRLSGFVALVYFRSLYMRSRLDYSAFDEERKQNPDIRRMPELRQKIQDLKERRTQ